MVVGVSSLFRIWKMLKFSGSILTMMTMIFGKVSGILNVDPDCHFRENLSSGRTYYAYNEEFPERFTGPKSCLWEALSPVGTKIVVNCDVDIPKDQDCSYGHVSVSITGNVDFESGESYCGNGYFTAKSTDNIITIGLSAPLGGNGRFSCTLHAQEVATTPAPTTTTTERNEQCQCGWSNTERIINGQETLPNEYPAMVGLINVIARTVFCGGVIISESYVLTAAHCAYNQVAEKTVVVVGDHNVKTGDDTDAAKVYRVNSFMMHPNYSKNSYYYNDVALVKVKGPILFSRKVGPVCLPFKYFYYDFAGKSVDVLGWGTTDPEGIVPADALQKADLTVLSNEQCQKKLDDNYLYLGGLLPSQMCAYSETKDSCQSDSGGPLIYTSESKHQYAVGLVSYGVSCALKIPSFNTRVTSYLQWILDSTPGENYCDK